MQTAATVMPLVSLRYESACRQSAAIRSSLSVPSRVVRSIQLSIVFSAVVYPSADKVCLLLSETRLRMLAAVSLYGWKSIVLFAKLAINPEFLLGTMAIRSRMGYPIS
jgi:hypothetical protein